MQANRPIAGWGRRGLLPVGMMLVVLFAAVSCSDSGTADGGGDGSQVASQTDEATPNDSPGVTDTEIKYASVGTGVNPTGICMAECFGAGVQAYFDWRNDTDGGIYGRKLVLGENLDDAMTQNKQRALEVVSANDSFGAFSAAVLPNGWEDIAAERIPLYTLGISFNEANGKDSIYPSIAVQCVSCVNRRTVYAATLAKAKKLATLGYGIAQSSKDCVESNKKSVAKYADKTGQEMVYANGDLSYGLPNGIAQEVTAMKDAGVEFISTCLDLNGVKTLEQELERQGMGDTPIMLANAYNLDTYKEAGDLFEGDYIAVSIRPFEADAGTSDLKTFQEWMGKTGQPATEIAMQGWIMADLAYQGLKAAGPNFTRESVIEATNKITDFTGGGLTPAIDWSRQHEWWTEADPVSHNFKQECISFVKYTNGQFEVVSGKDKPFLCWPADPSVWTEPTPTNFD